MPMHTPSPLVSVIIPCYNHGRYLQEAIDSVLRQAYPAKELIVVDDGSTDSTRQVARQNKEVRYVFQRNKGLSAARNTGIRHSAGQFLVFLDADDYLYENALQVNVDQLLQNEAVAFSSGAHHILYTDTQLVKPVVKDVTGDYYTHLLRGNFIGMHAAVMFRRWVFDRYRYDTSLKACEDYDLYLKVTRHHPMVYHPQVLAAYRQHGANMSGNPHLMLSTALRALKRQKRHLRTAAEHSAYAQGQAFWKEYYLTIFYDRFSVEPTLAPGDFKMLLTYDRPLLYEYLANKYREKVRRWGRKRIPAGIRSAFKLYWQKK
ncbi:glycosyltransferase [Pontibacter mangrovi]|uniref:Glycosyltransferase n=1 Tax=Pontibacter mangrovi TaxID=2589816 RepID=A0A501W0J8_9BACT|nr:glycosyltransferase [Pontibacter mangrovi]TPE43493.1 glycosyltransferase [Pontibacter mangrovi]